MRNPHLLGEGWNKTANGTKQDPLPVTVPLNNKKFKRKSREPKRLYHSMSAEPVGAISALRPDFTADDDSAEDTAAEVFTVSQLAAVQRQLMLSHEPSGVGGGVKPSLTPQSTAIDMRITNNVTGITARLAHLPNPNSHPLTPQPESLKLGHHSAFSTMTATSTSCHEHAVVHQTPHHHHPYTQDISLSARQGVSQVRGERTGSLPLPVASQSTYNGHTSETQDESPKGSPRKRMAVGGDPPSGRVPEIKALQQTRRLLANARERTRVHTISAAFEALRKQVPCYSYGQKLSKLAILRIACNYILSLAQLAELDYSPDHTNGTFAQCVEQCTRTLQAEGRSKKRKE